MLALPNECLFEIFTKLKNYNRCLFSCLLVNRQWCRNVVPILWSGPVPFENRKFIRTCLMALNSEEKAELIPFNIFLPINVKLLFKYTSYITTIKILSDDGIKKWLDLEGPPELAYHSDLNYIVRDAIETIRYSLVLMFLRTSNNIKDLKAYGMFYSKTTSLLIEIADKSTTVTNLSFWKNRLGPEGTKLLAEALCKNSTLTFLDLWV
ncbi:f-box domain-containing protein [Gigaspora margarita]|uniref:F-box domain-containing protein n=1 Tax=Gigaspora margarita TaxID=4874 RepID=A0A8H4B080_GIGMA|nr:f-box domain-containing protein [Gigaspora margarita]